MAKRIEERASFNLVRYANCWEDAEILCEALQPGPGKRFLSIASAGDNSFSLLSYGAQVVAVDLSPAQLACVYLRKAAFAQLSHAELLAFFGIRPCNNRPRTFHTLRERLPQPVCKFWDSRPESIRGGFIHEGKFESYLRTFRTKALRLVHSEKRIHQLLEPRNKEQRIAFYNKDWNTFRWRLLFRLFFSRFVMGRLGRDPEFFRYVEGSVAERILERTRHAVTELETHNNPFLTYILTGNFQNALPHYLHPQRFDAIRENLPNLQLAQMPIDKAAKQFGKDGFDGFNLSDIFEYLAPEICRPVYESLLEHARPAARFAYWNMLVPRSCPADLSDRIVQHHQLGQQLLQRDRAWFYSDFVIEEATGNSAGQFCQAEAGANQ